MTLVAGLANLGNALLSAGGACVRQPESPTALRVEEITCAAELEALRQEGSDLWERAPAATPFQSPEWLLPWWRHFGGEELWTLALRQGERLVGLAPFFISTQPATGERQVGLIGGGVIGELDILIAPEGIPSGGEVVLAYLAARGEHWDRCDFRDLAETSLLLWARHLIRVGLEITDEEEPPSPILELPDSVEELDQVIPREFLAELQGCRLRAEQDHPVWFASAGDGELEEALGVFRRGESAAPSGSAVLDGPGTEAFHRDVVRGFSARGWLRLHTLQVDGRIAAVHFGFLANGRAYSYLAGCDPRWEKLDPTGPLVLQAIEEAVREGAREFAFLGVRAGEKNEWGVETRPRYRQRIRKAHG